MALINLDNSPEEYLKALWFSIMNSPRVLFGSDIVKIFPGAQVGRPAFIKAIKGPMPWSNIMPTGGIEPSQSNLKEWFEAGAYCVGMGSKLFTKNKDGTFAYEKIAENIQISLRILEEIRPKND